MQYFTFKGKQNCYIANCVFTEEHGIMYEVVWQDPTRIDNERHWFVTYEYLIRHMTMD